MCRRSKTWYSIHINIAYILAQTVCPRSLVQFSKHIQYIKINKTSLTYSTRIAGPGGNCPDPTLAKKLGFEPAWKKKWIRIRHNKLDGCKFRYAHIWSKSGILICWRHLVTSKESSNHTSNVRTVFWPTILYNYRHNNFTLLSKNIMYFQVYFQYVVSNQLFCLWYFHQDINYRRVFLYH